MVHRWPGAVRGSLALLPGPVEMITRVLGPVAEIRLKVTVRAAGGEGGGRGCGHCRRGRGGGDGISRQHTTRAGGVGDVVEGNVTAVG